MKPNVQVVIMSYNRAEYLVKCIQSFLSQTYHDFELTVLDNASDQDIEGAICEIDDPRVSLIRNETNIGGVRNFEKACQIVESDYFMVFHDDDFANPRLLEYQIRAATEIPESVLVVSNCYIERDPVKMGDFVEDATYNLTRFDEVGDFFRAGLENEGRTIGFGGTLYKTSAVKESLATLNAQTERFSLCFDRPWIYFLGTKGIVLYQETPMYQVREHEGQNSMRLTSEYRHVLEYFKFQNETFGETMNFTAIKAWEDKVAEFLFYTIVWHVKHKRNGLFDVIRYTVRQDQITLLRLLRMFAVIIIRRMIR
jgi:glycosyltransferase involved in cell wall biosynthesis